ncbi:acetylornithine deacetylase [Candidatus Pantoea edessiphila]|uniref:Acetylornithine deacetylase n=1 Tax=Candidatus Pantoea edessiphila TaxID=2044610 RepID=A0A2P5SX94_9GAMM|nr:acetylornithine deacetylase [Candidatus Pantoea edessiphila]PPI86920.1 acetylornithine deacetylase [Candidatus Pantoea edessiphila]
MEVQSSFFIECYRKLISIPSISAIDPALDHSNEILINVLANWFNDIGFKVELYSIPNTRNKFNLLAKTGNGSGGLMLSGHTDTVPFDSSAWQYDPFVLTENNNRLYGLGTADMKGFFAFVISVLHNMNIKKLKKPLYILATADEETTMIGAKSFSQKSQLRPDIAIIGEPTSLKIINAHRGYISNIIRTKGDVGHSSNLLNGINAIELMQKAIHHLMKLRNQHDKEHYGLKHSDLIINFGHIKGGDVVNRVCSDCELHMDIRFLPNTTINNVNDMINQILLPIKNNWPNRIIVEELYPPIPAYQCNNNNLFIKKIKKILNKKTEMVHYCTEAPFIQQLCPTLVFGPGSINQAHQPNEFINMSYIKPTHDSIYKIIHYFCN